MLLKFFEIRLRMPVCLIDDRVAIAGDIAIQGLHILA